MLFVTLHQGRIVWAAFFCGILLGGAYDMLTALRIAFRRGVLVTILADLLMGAATAAATLWTLYRANEGELRLILLVVIGIGLLVYRIGVGRLLRGAWRRVLHRRRTGDGG